MIVSGIAVDQEVTRYRPVPRPNEAVVAGISSQIALALEEAILLGKIRSGERLVEAEVAAEMGTSNGPVREAFRELESLGLVKSVPRRGTFVTEFNVQLAREVFSLRALLEVAALRLAFPRLGKRDLERFDAALAAMSRFPGGPAATPRGLVDEDLRFHDILFDLCEHRLLQQAWERLRVQARTLLIVNRGLWNSAASSEEERATGMFSVHKSLVDAVRDQDLARIEREFVEHLAEGERLIIAKMAPGVEACPALVLSVCEPGGSPPRSAR
jgi:DNA-binding GntR family transcriptional regulator